MDLYPPARVGAPNVTREYRGDADRQVQALLLLLQEGCVPELNEKPSALTEGKRSS